MRGEKKIVICDKEVTFRLDLNAIIDFCEHYDIDFSGWESALNDPVKIRYFLFSMARSGDTDIDERTIGRMDLNDMSDVLSLITESSGNVKGLSKGSPKKK